MRNFILLTVLYCEIISGFIVPSNKYSRLLDVSILSENGRSGAKKKILLENSTDYKNNVNTGLKRTNKSGITLEKLQNKLPLQEHASVKESNVDERSFVFIDSKYKVPMLNHFHNLQQKVHKDYYLENANYKTFVSNVGSVHDAKFAEHPEPIKGFVDNNMTRVHSSGKVHWKHKAPAKYYDKGKKNQLITELQNMKNKIQNANSIVSRQYNIQGKQKNIEDVNHYKNPTQYSRAKLSYPYHREKPTPTTSIPIRVWKVKTPNENNIKNTQKYLLEVKKPVPMEKKKENKYQVQASIQNDKPMHASIGNDLPMQATIGNDLPMQASIGNDMQMQASIGNDIPIQSSIGNGIPIQSSIGNGIPIQSSIGNGIPIQSSMGNGIPIQPFSPVEQIDRKIKVKNEDISTIVFTDEHRDHLELLKPPLLRQESDKNIDNHLHDNSHTNEAGSNNYKFQDMKKPSNYFMSAYMDNKPTEYPVLKDVISKFEESGLEDHFRSDDTLNNGEDKILDRFIKNTPDDLGENEKAMKQNSQVCGGKKPSDLCRCGFRQGKVISEKGEIPPVRFSPEKDTEDDFDDMYNKV